MAKRKFSPAQIAAQKRFAEMAKAGKFRKRKKAAKRNPRGVKKKTIEPVKGEKFENWQTIKADGREYYLRKVLLRFGRKPAAPWELLPDDGRFNKYFKTKSEALAFIKTGKDARRYKNPRADGFPRGSRFHVTEYIAGKENVTRTFNNFDGAARYAQANLYDRIKAHAGLDTKWGRAAYEKMRDAIMNNEGATVSVKGDQVILKIETPGGARYMERNPVKKGAKRRPPARRNPVERYVIKGEQKTRTGYLYYYLKGNRFVSDYKGADRFTSATGVAKMRAIQPQLPTAIRSITLSKVR